MKKFLQTTLLSVALMAPMAATSAVAQDRGEQGEGRDRSERGEGRDRGDRDGGRNDSSQNDSRRGDRDDEARRSDRRDRYERRRSWRDDRAEASFDRSMHNGYFRGNRWYSGPPPVQYRDARLGYRPWARGQRLGYYSTRYNEVDYRQHNLRRPPRGYHWVRDDDGDYLLAALVGGLIAQVILESSRNDRYDRNDRR